MAETPGLGDGDAVVVTGGAGFLGSTLVDSLLERGCRVTVIDDLSNGVLRNLPIEHERLTVVRVTVGATTSAQTVDRCVADSDAVFHLASPIGVERAHSQRYAVIASILDGGRAIIEACRRHRRPLLFTSSSEVYGPGRDRPISESDPMVADIRPRWGYAVGKAAVEHLVAGLFVEYAIPAWIVRPFNMAGARQKPATGLVMPTFTEQALNGAPLVVHDDGQQTRAFLHAEDAAAGLIAIMQCPALQGTPVNLGGTDAIRIGDLARMVIGAAKSTSRIEMRPSKVVFGDDFAATRNRIPDIGLLHSATGWRPTLSTEHVVADCIRYLRCNRAAA